MASSSDVDYDYTLCYPDEHTLDASSFSHEISSIGNEQDIVIYLVEDEENVMIKHLQCSYVEAFICMFVILRI